MPEYPTLSADRPTMFDPPVLPTPDDHANWRIVAAVHRDSDALDRSNYDEARALLAEIDAAELTDEGAY